MLITKVGKLPVAIEGLMDFKEVEKTPLWTLTYTWMKAETETTFHSHTTTEEIHVIAQGAGSFVTERKTFAVRCGHTIYSPREHAHKIVNANKKPLVYLTLAAPRFDRADIHLDRSMKNPPSSPIALRINPIKFFPDGYMGIAYRFAELGNVRFLKVPPGLLKNSLLHYHKAGTEFLYVASGQGHIKIDEAWKTLGTGSLVRVDPMEKHVIFGSGDNGLEIISISTHPSFEDDVYFE